jgi:hypothetical protein
MNCAANTTGTVSGAGGSGMLLACRTPNHVDEGRYSAQVVCLAPDIQGALVLQQQHPGCQIGALTIAPLPTSCTKPLLPVQP